MIGGSRALLLVLALASGVVGPVPVSAQGRRPQAATPSEPCPGDTQRERIAQVGPGGGLLLASGREVRLADVRFPEPAEAGVALAGRPAPAWLASLVGSEVIVQAFGSPDRWGRLQGIVSLPPGSGSAAIEVAELLVGEGLALVDVGERDALCRPGLLAIEAAARAGRRGLWAAAGEPLPAAEPDGLRERVGQFALVEGRVASVGERKDRTYLNFGRDFARDFAVSIPKRGWAAMKRAGLSADALRGRVVRVRGILELRRAPSMEIVAADMIEVVDAGRPRPGPGDAAPRRDGAPARRGDTPVRPVPEEPAPVERDPRPVPDSTGTRL